MVAANGRSVIVNLTEKQMIKLCYTQKTSRGHELRLADSDDCLRLATPAEVAASDAEAERDGGEGVKYPKVGLGRT